jgi:nucleotide-binding universal stress UspA family protein
MAKIVVGVDGSAQSARALRIAALEARCRSAHLEAVHVYHPAEGDDSAWTAAAAASLHPGAGVMMTDRMVEETRERAVHRQEEARRHAEGMVDRMLDAASDALHGVAAEAVVIADDHPARTLVRLSADADMLVVGSRGRGGFTGLLLGSVSQQCVHHASCPVLVIRPEPPR